MRRRIDPASCRRCWPSSHWVAAAGCSTRPAPASRSGRSDQAHARPTRSGPVLYAEPSPGQMVAEGTATYTYSGSSGGGETQSGSGVDALPALGAGRADVRRRRHRHVADDRPDARRPAARRRLPRAAAGQGAAAQQAVAQGVDDPQDGPRPPAATRSPSRCAPRSTPARAWACCGPPAGSTEVGPATGRGRADHPAPGDRRPAPGGRLVEDAAAREQYQAMLAAGVRTLEYDAVAGRDAGCRARSSAAVPTTQGLFSVTGVYRALGRPGAASTRRGRSRSSTPTRSRADARRVSAICRGPVPADVRSPLPQTAGRRSRKGVAEGPASCGRPA